MDFYLKFQVDLIALELFGTVVHPDFVQRFGFNLPDALARNAEFLADFLQCMRYAVIQAETHF